MIWRVGVVPYLNADPLAAALREPDAALLVGDAVEVQALVPSKLLGALLDRQVDVALVSTGGILPHPDLRILPEMCIASDGPVRSIQLYFRKPLAEVRTVALDASSRSAVALTRVLFAERWSLTPEFVTLPPDLEPMLAEADAALLIGNPALLANQTLRRGEWKGAPLDHLDLGEEWRRMTGLPFVYAVWAAPADLDLERLTAVLLRAKSWGMRRRSLLASRGAAELGLLKEVTLEYLTHAIRYDLGPRERAGMERFCDLARKHGILPGPSAVRLADVRVQGSGFRGSRAGDRESGGTAEAGKSGRACRTTGFPEPRTLNPEP